ncbi:DUF2934 domain-containing protein [Bradyrhizobium sp. 76]|uniref:DUF2934 domain-containing protein n=1 Tax=Bradyrhizobium sp. 76 TaxID=2782680 RepID=UPI001FF760A9|nr:DUF2934 domain-containing protein [Bradyrhizobium sp. 76]MCK1409383.1 DUF2934 domain-containing protein [Bradyrhizobium sp. 76]
MTDLEQSIRERAYELWLESGCVDGNSDAHWLAAQREVVAARLGALARVSTDAKSKVKKAAGSKKSRRAA